MTASTSHAAHSTVQGTQQLVLLGAGTAHLQLLAHLAVQPLPQTQVVLVTPHPSTLIPGMLAGLVAGHYTLDDCAVALEPLVQRSGIRWMERSAVAVDMARQTLQLDDGSTLAFDWLSVNTGPIQERASIEHTLPGAREQALFTRPAEVFATLWPRVVAMGEERPLRIAVIGEGQEGVELALAARHRLPNAAVTLVCGPTAPGALYAPLVQDRLLGLLKQRRVTVLQDVAKSLHDGNVQLGCGADLACDVPVLAATPQPPLWVAGSGLALDPAGYPAVDVYQRSTSHSRVFAIGDGDIQAAHTATTPAEPDLLAGAALAHNLASAMAGTALKPHLPAAPAWRILTGGGRYAVGSWRGFSAQGRWVWWLKNWRDRRLVARCKRSDP